MHLGILLMWLYLGVVDNNCLSRAAYMSCRRNYFKCGIFHIFQWLIHPAVAIYMRNMEAFIRLLLTWCTATQLLGFGIIFMFCTHKAYRWINCFPYRYSYIETYCTFFNKLFPEQTAKIYLCNIIWRYLESVTFVWQAPVKCPLSMIPHIIGPFSLILPLILIGPQQNHSILLVPHYCPSNKSLPLYYFSCNNQLYRRLCLSVRQSVTPYLPCSYDYTPRNEV